MSNLWSEQDARSLPGNLEFLRRALRREVEVVPTPNGMRELWDEFLHIGPDDNYLVQFAAHPKATPFSQDYGFHVTAFEPSQRNRWDEPPDVDEVDLGFIKSAGWAASLARMILMYEAKRGIDDSLDALAERMQDEKFDDAYRHRHCPLCELDRLNPGRSLSENWIVNGTKSLADYLRSNNMTDEVLSADQFEDGKEQG